MNRFSLAPSKSSSKKEGTSSRRVWISVLLFAGLIILSASALTYAQNGAPLSIEVSASTSQGNEADYSHALGVSWKVTGGTPPYDVTLEITGPDGKSEVHHNEASEGTKQFKLAYPDGGTVLVNINVGDSSGSSASGMTSVSLEPSPRVEIDEVVPDKGILACRKMVFSTEEDFVMQGPEPADGNPIISDGDLLGEGCVVCARNADLLQAFTVPVVTHVAPNVMVDLGLDAVDIIDVDRYLVAFSTELDSPNTGQFTAGDLLITNGAVIPNAALLYGFGLRKVDLGLDAVHFVGESSRIIEFVDYVRSAGREYWLREGALQASLRQYGLDIWFSTEGTGPYPTQPAFLDGDLLSARDGTIVIPNPLLLPPGVPAGIPNRGVDFGLDAVTSDRDGNRKLIQFSTEILYKGELSFTDGDVLIVGNGIVHTNDELIKCFEPKADFVGLDALSILEVSQPPCGAAIIRVGGMPAGSINADGLANGPSATTPIFDAYDSPFGAWVEIIGLMPSCEECEEFKVEYGQWLTPSIAPTTWTPLTDGFKEWAFIWPSTFLLVSRVPDGDGWLSILCDTTMGGLYYPWNTAGRNGKYSLRLTVKDTGGIEHVSSPVVVMLDNTAPGDNIPSGAVLNITSSPVCGDIVIGDTVTGTITATDPHFYSYRLRYESSLASGLILPVRKYTGVSDTGDANVAFSWDTTGLPACGYRIILEVWDRTIRSNRRHYGEPGFGWRSPKQYYFCLEAAE